MADLTPHKPEWAGTGYRTLEARLLARISHVQNSDKEMKQSLWQILMAIAFLPVLLGSSLSALSAEQTVTLRVNLWCPSCSYIIKRTLAKVPGVLDENVSFDDQVTVARFDDDKVDVTALTQATAAVSFPSEPAATYVSSAESSESSATY